MDCDFNNDSLTCPRCGFNVGKIGGARDWRLNCAGVPITPPPPPLFKRLKNFTVAAIGHALDGFPTCTQDEIDARFAVCRACELYRPNSENPDVGLCTHTDCGCPVTREDKYVSKLGWREDGCPLGKWAKLSPAESPARP